MSSFLLFTETKPVEVQYTSLAASGEERYVIKVGEVGTVIRKNENDTWEVIGKNKLDTSLVQQIGENIILHTS